MLETHTRREEKTQGSASRSKGTEKPHERKDMHKACTGNQESCRKSERDRAKGRLSWILDNPQAEMRSSPKEPMSRTRGAWHTMVEREEWTVEKGRNHQAHEDNTLQNL
jgi:hypothetical protein